MIRRRSVAFSNRWTHVSSKTRSSPSRQEYGVPSHQDAAVGRGHASGAAIWSGWRCVPEFARALLRSYLDEVNRLAAEPKWYNAFTKNCTTTIRFHVQQAAVRNPLDWRILVNAKGDELLYERGTIDTSLPFTEVRARSDITAQAKAADQDPDFSRRIREGRLPRPGAP
jgi:hypothetical protein